MKTKEELLQMLFAKLAELQNMIKIGVQPSLLMALQTEVALLYDILGEDIPEEYWEQIEEVI